MNSHSVEEYLEAIFNCNELGERAKTTDLARSLKVSPPSVTQMVQKLADDGFVEYKPYRGAILTGKGVAYAQKVVRKHRLIETFLHDQLGISNEKVHEEACKMEHSFSDEVAAALCNSLDQPTICPDDNKPIPPCTIDVKDCDECSQIRGNEAGRLLTQLSYLKINEKGIVAFIRAGNQACQRLLDLGLTKGTEVEVVSAAPFKGPVEVRVRDTNIALGRGLAGHVFVEISDNVQRKKKHHRVDHHHISTL